MIVHSKEPNMIDEFVTHCAVDIAARRFTLVSSEGAIKSLDCEDGDQFLRVLDVVRGSLDSSQVVYT
jgi:hypothetical protein